MRDKKKNEEITNEVNALLKERNTIGERQAIALEMIHECIRGMNR